MLKKASSKKALALGGSSRSVQAQAAAAVATTKPMVRRLEPTDLSLVLTSQESTRAERSACWILAQRAHPLEKNPTSMRRVLAPAELCRKLRLTLAQHGCHPATRAAAGASCRALPCTKNRGTEHSNPYVSRIATKKEAETSFHEEQGQTRLREKPEENTVCAMILGVRIKLSD
ncbi:hypothetical protein GUJ93_ZPchr0013g36904 [Zizania palustris]|uniref:Uncharacterized protein n=1 Tax=Zizania palustris TaxID=103762 RepID=A0A8J5WUJ4_ZIZPA|nr:hypothetical protein GUJ93_ZPchr0013g36904 [Zizania palustris]